MGTPNNLPEAREFALRRMEKYSEMDPSRRNKRVISDVRRKYGIILSDDQVYRIWKKVSDLRDELGEFSDDVGEGKKKYEVVGTDYILYGRNRTFRLSVESVDRIFKDYSKFGGNLTEEEILRKYKLVPEAWHLLKRALRLYKASNVISPHTAESVTEEELDHKVEEATGVHFDVVKEKMIVSHRKRFEKEAKDALRLRENLTYFLDLLKDYVSKCGNVPASLPELSEAPAPGEVSVFLSDTHFRNGKFDEVNARLSELADEALANPAGKVNIFFLGDLAEALCPELMHDSQIPSMGFHNTFETIMSVVTSLKAFISKIASKKLVSFHGIGGNHDRVSRLHDQDIRRTGALVIFEFVKQAYERVENSRVEVSYYTEKINTVGSGNLNYVFHHGDDGFSNRKPEEILWKNGRNDRYNVVVHGDKHTLKMQETKNGMMIGVPALCGQGEYDKRLDLHSEPGAVIISENRHGTADVRVKRL